MEEFMKLLLVFTFLFGSFSLFAKKDIDFKSFNKQVNKNIDEVIQENPQLYETKELVRKPASVELVEPESTDKLDEIQEQADSHMGW
jgi:hypothetical protein